MFVPVLLWSDCWNKIPRTQLLINHRNFFFPVLEIGSPGSRCQPGCGGPSRLQISHRVRVVIPCEGSSRPEPPPESCPTPTKTITLGHCNFNTRIVRARRQTDRPIDVSNKRWRENSWGPGSKLRQADSYLQSRFSEVWLNRYSAGNPSLFWGSVLRFEGWLGKFLTSTHKMPGLPSFDHQKCLQTWPHAIWWGRGKPKSPPFRNHMLYGLDG